MPAALTTTQPAGPFAEGKRRIAAAVDGARAEILDLSHRIHANPEPAFEEHRAAAWCAEVLAAHGFAVGPAGVYHLACETGPAGSPLHLLDPATAEPRVTPVRSVTVTAPTCLAADAAATAVFGMAPERAARLLQARAPGARIVRTIATDA